MWLCDRNPIFLNACEKIRSHPRDVTLMYDFDERKPDSGAHGEVRKAKERATGELVAVKIIEKSSLTQPSCVNNLLNEIKALSALSHPHLLDFRRALHDDENIYLICEYVSKVTVSLLAARLAFRVPEADALRLVRDVLEGLAHMHAHAFGHFDVKPGNIMMTPDTRVKLIDFGFSEKLPSVSRSICKGFSATQLYRAPEIGAQRPYAAEKADVFGVGSTLYEMIAGVEHVRERPVKYIEVVTPETNAFMLLLTDPDPAKRPTAKEAIEKLDQVMRKLTIRSYMVPLVGELLFGYKV